MGFSFNKYIYIFLNLFSIFFVKTDSFLKKNNNKLKTIGFLYSHFLLIVFAVLLSFFSFSFCFYFLIKAFIYKIYYLIFSILLLLLTVPYIIDMLSRGIYDYPFFAMTFFQKDKFYFNKINIFLYKYAKFCFFCNSFFIFSLIVLSIISFFHMIIFSKLICSFNAYIGFLFIIFSFVPVALEMFNYSWFNKTFYL